MMPRKISLIEGLEKSGRPPRNVQATVVVEHISPYISAYNTDDGRDKDLVSDVLAGIKRNKRFA